MSKLHRTIRAFLVGTASIGIAFSGVSAQSLTARSFQATEISRAPISASLWESSNNLTRKESVPHGIQTAVVVPPKPISLVKKHLIVLRASRSRRLVPKLVRKSVDLSQYPYYARPHEIYYTSNCPAGPQWVMDLARDITTARFGSDQWASQKTLILRESNGNPWCENSVGAYGVPQALPGSKMGGNWRFDVKLQLEWMCGYEAGRYHDPDGALAHSNRLGWY